MTQPRDPDIMAMDHAIKALLKSTPRMLANNIDFVSYVIHRRLAAVPSAQPTKGEQDE